ncbi:MAG: hypothetical protein ACREEB_07390 [Caulobacteraceae bacterium]
MRHLAANVEPITPPQDDNLGGRRSNARAESAANQIVRIHDKQPPATSLSMRFAYEPIFARLVRAPFVETARKGEIGCDDGHPLILGFVDVWRLVTSYDHPEVLVGLVEDRT